MSAVCSSECFLRSIFCCMYASSLLTCWSSICSGQVISAEELSSSCFGRVSNDGVCFTRCFHRSASEHQHMAQQVDTATDIQWHCRSFRDQRVPWRLWSTRCCTEYGFIMPWKILLQVVNFLQFHYELKSSSVAVVTI